MQKDILMVLINITKINNSDGNQILKTLLL